MTPVRTKLANRLCRVCYESVLKGIINYGYMVTKETWEEAGFVYEDMAHIGCLEKRLGRPLVKADLTDVPMNRILHWILDQGLELPKD